jgi:hypothetical protein
MLLAGCDAGATSPDDTFKDWSDFSLSEESEARLEEEERVSEESKTDEEKQDELLAWYEENLTAAREEEQRLLKKLQDIREIAALPELDEARRARYIELAAETEAEITACKEEQARVEANIEAIHTSRMPPPDIFDDEDINWTDEWPEYEQ